MKEDKYLRQRALQEQLEKEGKFDVDVRPFSTDNMLPIDGNYQFLCTKWYEKVFKTLIFAVLCVIWRPVLFFGAGFRIRGKENKKGVKGCIAVSNHAFEIDAIAMHTLSTRPWRLYHTGGQFNMKKGILSELLKLLGYLPIAASFGAQKNFQKTIQNKVEHGCVVHFYPEHALWSRYEKVRPFKSGAFKIAAKINAPVLPAFVSFEETKFRKFFHMQKRAVLNILPPVYPDKNLTCAQNAIQMQERSHAEMTQAYERIYGKKMILNVTESELS